MSLSDTTPTTDRPLPLLGVRVIECGVWHAGPGACAILADLGADVIKLESLDGDPERAQRSLGSVRFSGSEDQDWSLLFEISNRNKRGICIDISSPEGGEVLRRLLEVADVLVTNYKRKTIAKLKVDYESARAINPRIIHMTVSGYGADGPLADVGGFDPMGQAVSGLSLVTGSSEPVILQTVILDQITAITASHAILAALFWRERSGKGQALHASLYGSGVWTLYANLITTSVTKQNVSSGWDRRVMPPLRNTYKCKDGKWIVGTNHPEHKFWPAFCAAVGLDWAQNDELYATPQARADHAPSLIVLIDEVMSTKTRDEWLQVLNGQGLQFVPVNTCEDVLDDAQALANEYIVEVDHPMLGRVRVPGYPVWFSETGVRFDPAPVKGQHTASVLAEIGFDEQQIRAM